MKDNKSNEWKCLGEWENILNGPIRKKEQRTKFLLNERKY